jgi:hypothetical protein
MLLDGSSSSRPSPTVRRSARRGSGGASRLGLFLARVVASPACSRTGVFGVDAALRRSRDQSRATEGSFDGESRPALVLTGNDARWTTGRAVPFMAIGARSTAICFRYSRRSRFHRAPQPFRIVVVTSRRTSRLRRAAERLRPSQPIVVPPPFGSVLESEAERKCLGNLRIAGRELAREPLWLAGSRASRHAFLKRSPENLLPPWRPRASRSVQPLHEVSLCCAPDSLPPLDLCALPPSGAEMGWQGKGL